MAETTTTPETKSYRRLTIFFRSGGSDVHQLLAGDDFSEAPNGTYNLTKFGGMLLVTYERGDVRSVRMEHVVEILNAPQPRSPYDFDLK